MPRIRVFGILLFFLFLGSSTVQAASIGEPVMTFQEVERLIDSSPNKEVRAYFRSVPRGTKPISYKIVLRGVLKTPDLTVILFTTRHKIVAGMSGSPVYVNGKNIGAMGYSVGSFNFSNSSWGGISPISLMMEDAKSGLQRQRGAFTYKGMFFKPIAMGNRSIKGLEDFYGGEFFVSSQNVQRISSRNNSFGKKPVLKPGMPIVVNLAEWTDENGEITSLGGLGTITYIDNMGRIFAFGHPFLDAKAVVYSFRTAEVVGTVLSESSSFKLSGKRSEILGAITIDSSHGIYGNIGSDQLGRLRHFSLELKREGKKSGKFDIKVADTVFAPILAQVAFNSIGQKYGAPIPQETSTTQIESRVEIDGQKPILWKGQFVSSSFRSNLETFYVSSYKSAYESFFARVYNPLFDNKYGLKVLDTAISVNFLSGRSQVFKMGTYRFPNKVTYGQNPILELLLVDENNIMPIAKKVQVQIDWSKVERPVYTVKTPNTQKSLEKIVNGELRIESAASYFGNLSNLEKQIFTPEYFLGPEDFLANLSSRLKLTNQKVFVKVKIRSRSGLFDETVAKAKDIMPDQVLADDSDWYVIGEGLKERMAIVKNEGMETFYVDLPDIPTGYVLDQRIQEVFPFEVILEN